MRRNLDNFWNLQPTTILSYTPNTKYYKLNETSKKKGNNEIMKTKHSIQKH